MSPLFYEAEDRDQNTLLRDVIRKRMGVSRNLLARLKTLPGGIAVNGEEKTVRYQVQVGDRIILATHLLGQGTDIPPEPGPLQIIYEDSWLLVVCKPPGMTMYPRYKGEGGSLAGRVLAYLSLTQTHPTFHPMGRLDKDTSGLVLLAKSTFVAGSLQDRITGKFYLARTCGKIDRPGIIDLPLGKREICSPGQGPMAVMPGGQEARTSYWPLSWDDSHDASLILAQLHTGRRHQIRVHMSYLGHPLFGDSAYGGPGSGGQALWCVGLHLTFPGHKQPLKLHHIPGQDPRLACVNPIPILSDLDTLP